MGKQTYLHFHKNLQQNNFTTLFTIYTFRSYSIFCFSVPLAKAGFTGGQNVTLIDESIDDRSSVTDRETSLFGKRSDVKHIGMINVYVYIDHSDM